MEYKVYLNDLLTNSRNIKNDEKNIIYLQIFYILEVDKIVNKFLEFDKVKIYLDLSSLYLKEIPKPIFKLTNLYKLFLGTNLLECIPDDISKLENLQILDISDNKLTYISPEILKLSKLESLDISYNSFLIFPKMLYSMKLKNLYIKDFDYYNFNFCKL